MPRLPSVAVKKWGQQWIQTALGQGHRLYDAAGTLKVNDARVCQHKRLTLCSVHQQFIEKLFLVWTGLLGKHVV